jgi:Tat protein translocase TatB subunit
VDFLNVGPWELVVVLIIAILVAGPKRMVEIARTLGQFSRQLRDMSREFTMTLQSEIQATEEEASTAGAELREVQKDLQDALAVPPQLDPDADSRSDAHTGSGTRNGEEA